MARRRLLSTFAGVGVGLPCASGRSWPCFIPDPYGRLGDTVLGDPALGPLQGSAFARSAVFDPPKVSREGPVAEGLGIKWGRP